MTGYHCKKALHPPSKGMINPTLKPATLLHHDLHYFTCARDSLVCQTQI